MCVWVLCCGSSACFHFMLRHWHICQHWPYLWLEPPVPGTSPPSGAGGLGVVPGQSSSSGSLIPILKPLPPGVHQVPWVCCPPRGHWSRCCWGSSLDSCWPFFPRWLRPDFLSSPHPAPDIDPNQPSGLNLGWNTNCPGGSEEVIKAIEIVAPLVHVNN